MAFQGSDNDDFGQNEQMNLSQELGSNDYLSIFNEDAEETEQDYKQFIQKLDMNTLQPDDKRHGKKKKSYKKREIDHDNYDHYDHNNNNNSSTYNSDNDDNKDNDYINDSQYNDEHHQNQSTDNDYNDNNHNNSKNSDKHRHIPKVAPINYKWQWDAG